MPYKPVDTNILIVVGPLIDDTDFKTREELITYDQAGMEIDVILEKADGTVSTTAVVPTTAGNYDWTHTDQGYYTLELIATGGVSYNNDTEGILTVVGFCTGVLPFRSVSYDIVPVQVYNSIVAGSDLLQVDTTQIEGVDATNQVGDAVWDEDIVAAHGTADTAGRAVRTLDTVSDRTNNANLNSLLGVPDSAGADVANTVWDEDATGHQTLGTFGQAIGDPVADANTIFGAVVTGAAGATIAADIILIQADTDDLQTKLGTPANLGSGATVAANLSDIEGQTDDIGIAGAGLTAIPWNASWDAEVESEAVDALVAQRLDELLNADSDIDGLTPPTVGSVFHELLTKTPGSFTYDQTTDSLEANRDNIGTAVGASISVDIAAVEAQTDDIGIAGAGLTAVPWNAVWDAEVESEATDALVVHRLDELLNADSDIDGVAPPTVGSVFHELMSKTVGGFTFDQTTDSNEAVRDKLTDIETDTAEIGVAGVGLTSITNYVDKIDDATDGLTAIKAEVEGLAGAAMRGTDNAALASVCTETRLAELDAANIPTDLTTINGFVDKIDDVGDGLTAIKAEVEGLAGAAMRGTDNAALASVCTEVRLAELGAANIPSDVDTLLTRLTAARAGYLDELAAANLPADVTAILTDTGTTLDALIKRALGLSQENFYIDNTVFDGSGNMTACRLRTYSVAGSVGTANNVLATYNITATYTGTSMDTYSVVQA